MALSAMEDSAGCFFRAALLTASKASALSPEADRYRQIAQRTDQLYVGSTGN